LGSKKKLGDRLTLTVTAEEMVASLEDSFILSSIIISTTIRRNKKKERKKKKKSDLVESSRKKSKDVVALCRRCPSWSQW
jgi:hypothetical protein